MTAIHADPTALGMLMRAGLRAIDRGELDETPDLSEEVRLLAQRIDSACGAGEAAIVLALIPEDRGGYPMAADPYVARTAVEALAEVA